MKKPIAIPDEFYVGYLPKAPCVTAKFVRWVVLIVFFLGLILCSIVVWHQKKFSPATFEYGVNSEIEGYIFTDPIPHLLMSLGKDIHDKPLYQTVLLVGEGKAGATDVINDFEKMLQEKVDGRKVKLMGSLLYGNGKVLMQLGEVNEQGMEFIGERMDEALPSYASKDFTLRGEIVDPKCYFGVMKPGEGKVHRSCAIRCISGGIPPIFYSSKEYYILMNENNQPIQAEVLSLVGDQLTLSGKVVTWNDWKILKINSKEIEQLSNAKKESEILIAFEDNITFCNSNFDNTLK